MKLDLSNIKFFRYLNSKIPPPLRRHYSYYKKTTELIHSTNKYSTKEILAFQLRQINKILEIGWKIDGYKRYWKEKNFNKTSIQYLDEIVDIPIITKEIIKENRELFKPVNQNYKTINTGGSTGAPFLIYEPKVQSRIEIAFIHDAWKQFYYETSINTKATILRGNKAKNDWYYDPMKGLILSTFSLSKKSVKNFKSLIEHFQTPILHAYPSSLFLFVKLLKKYNLKINHSFNCICLGSEPLYDYQYNSIKKYFKAPISHWYGQGEKVVFAATRPDDRSFSVYPQYGFTEVLDENGLKQTKGKVGKIIGTSFWNTAVPLIRYDTKDTAIVSKYPEDSKSNYSFKLDEISGRSQDFILTKNNSLIPITALNVTCSKYDEINRVRFYQKKIGEVKLLFELMPDVSPFDPKNLILDLEDLTKNSINITTKQVDKLEPTTHGKHVYLEQELDLDVFLKDE